MRGFRGSTRPPTSEAITRRCGRRRRPAAGHVEGTRLWIIFIQGGLLGQRWTACFSKGKNVCPAPEPWGSRGAFAAKPGSLEQGEEVPAYRQDRMGPPERLVSGRRALACALHPPSGFGGSSARKASSAVGVAPLRRTGNVWGALGKNLGPGPPSGAAHLEGDDSAPRSPARRPGSFARR